MADFDPRLADHTLEAYELWKRLCKAQRKLPASRRRDPKGLQRYVRASRVILQSHMRTVLAMRAPAQTASQPSLPSVVSAPEREKRARSTISAALRESIPVLPASRAQVRWSQREYALVAREMAPYLGAPVPINRPTFADRLAVAQTHCLPPDRWRPRSGLYRAIFEKPPMDILTMLREAHKHEGVPLAARPEPVAASVEAPVAAPAPVAPGLMPSAPALAMALAFDAMVAQSAVGMEDRIAARCVAQLRGDIAGMVGEAVRAAVIEVLGAPSAPTPVPPAGPPPTPTPAPVREPEPEPVAPVLHSPPEPKREAVAVPVPREVAKPEPERARKKRVDVVGLVGGQMTIVQQAIGEAFDLRFVSANHCSGTRQKTYSTDVVMCTKFVSHDAQESIRAKGGRIHYANGAAASVIDILRTLPRAVAHAA